MELLTNFIDLFVHLDDHLSNVIQNYGTWTYAILFVIIFCETGLVVTPFLPGDSLLFVVGTLAARGSLNLGGSVTLLAAAAIAGNTLNYYIGHLLAPRIFRGEKIKFLKQEYLDRTHKFFEKHGGKTIIITRFLPILRTFAPFLAGMGAMTYWRFTCYNIAGGILWVLAFVLGGYFFGNIPAVRENFTLVIFMIIIISMLPAVFEFFRHRHKN